MSEGPPGIQYVYGVIGSIAGGISSLTVSGWKNKSRTEVWLSIFVAATFSFFVAPLMFAGWMDTRAAGGIFYLMATGSNVLIPPSVRWLRRLAGVDPSGDSEKHP